MQIPDPENANAYRLVGTIVIVLFILIISGVVAYFVYGEDLGIRKASNTAEQNTNNQTSESSEVNLDSEIQQLDSTMNSVDAEDFGSSKLNDGEVGL